jgi:hypothetical protein
VPRVRSLLIEAAREGHAVTYAGLLGRLGLGFTRPKMRALCRTLSRIDEDAAAAGEPELAVLVVRQSDALPGQGWWTGHAAATGYAGGWTGERAVREVARLQQRAFRHWSSVDTPELRTALRSPIEPTRAGDGGATGGRA